MKQRQKKQPKTANEIADEMEKYAKKLLATAKTLRGKTR